MPAHGKKTLWASISFLVLMSMEFVLTIVFPTAIARTSLWEINFIGSGESFRLMHHAVQ